ncbi:MAG: Ctr copper transporter family-domain-containing protein [Monoraphidium minutum]|nr:MAG: Ctr copper transporter family-domain-containing protein [Monoraphidium minutum]
MLGARTARRALRALLLLAAAAAVLAVDCVTTPTDPSCATFKLPNATAVTDLNALCSAMHFMTGCSLYKACNATTRANVGADPTICDPFQQLATICARDPGMGGMGGCRAHYAGMCANGSVVRQCRASPGFGLVSTEDSNKWVRSICEEMDMEGCDRCTPAWKEGKVWGGPNCDPFAVYGWLCVQMPDMWQCMGPGRWDEMCRKDPTLYACVGDAPALTDKGWWRPGGGSGGGGGGGGDAPAPGGGGDSPYKPGPSMKMYFFNQMPFWLLFKEWVPSTRGELAGAWFAIFLLGIFYEAVQTLKYRVEAAWLAQDANRAAAAAAPPGDCPCGDAHAVAVEIPPPDGGPGAGSGGGVPAVTMGSGGGCCNGAAGGLRPLGEGAEGSSCCSSRPTPENALLTVPLAPAPLKRSSFDQLAPPPGRACCAAPGAAGPRRRRGMPSCGCAGGRGGGGGGGAGAWVAAQRAPGGALDGAMLTRDAARAALTFVTTALSYALMLAAMSFHVAIFFAVCAGVAAGTAIFGRFRSYVAIAHNDGCCC